MYINSSFYNLLSLNVQTAFLSHHFAFSRFIRKQFLPVNKELLRFTIIHLFIKLFTFKDLFPRRLFENDIIRDINITIFQGFTSSNLIYDQCCLRKDVDDTKLHLMVRFQFWKIWEVWSTSSLPLLPVPL